MHRGKQLDLTSIRLDNLNSNGLSNLLLTRASNLNSFRSLSIRADCCQEAQYEGGGHPRDGEDDHLRLGQSHLDVSDWAEEHEKTHVHY